MQQDIEFELTQEEIRGKGTKRRCKTKMSTTVQEKSKRERGRRSR